MGPVSLDAIRSDEDGAYTPQCSSAHVGPNRSSGAAEVGLLRPETHVQKETQSGCLSRGKSPLCFNLADG